MNDSVLVDPDDVRHATGEQDFDGGGSRRADPGHHHPQPPELLANDPETIEEGGQNDDCRAVLVVMKHRNVELLAKAILDLEAARSRDVLQIDAPEAGGNQLHGLHNGGDVLRTEADGKGIDARELLEEHGFALHHRQGGLRSDVAQAQDGGAIRHDGDAVLLHGEGEGSLAIVPDSQTDTGHPGGVNHRQVVAGANRHLVADLDLATQVHQEGPVRDVDDLDTGHSFQTVHDLLTVMAVPGLDGDVPDDAGGQRLHDVNCSDIPPCPPDSHGYPTEHARPVGDRQTHREAVTRTWGDAHPAVSLPLSDGVCAKPAFPAGYRLRPLRSRRNAGNVSRSVIVSTTIGRTCRGAASKREVARGSPSLLATARQTRHE